MPEPDDAPLAKPGEDPFYIEWPDDTEREVEMIVPTGPPAPRLLTVMVIGIVVVFAFVFAVAAMGRSFGMFFVTAPLIVVAALVVGLPVGWILDRAVSSWRRSFSDPLFLVVGGILGYGWTYGAVTRFPEYFTEDPAAHGFVRSVLSVFMMTAVATAFYISRTAHESLQRRRRVVYAMALGLALTTVGSVVAVLLMSR